MESEKIYRYYQWASWMELYFKDNNMEVPVWFKTDEVRNWTYEKWLSRVDFSIDIFNEEGEVVTQVKKVLYVAKKRTS